MTHTDLMRRIPAWELSEWEAFFVVDGPTGDVRADLQAALIASTLANIFRNTKKRKAPYKPADFMLRFDRPRQTPEEQLAIVRRLNQSLGGRDLTADRQKARR